MGHNRSPCSSQTRSRAYGLQRTYRRYPPAAGMSLAQCVFFSRPWSWRAVSPFTFRAERGAGAPEPEAVLTFDKRHWRESCRAYLKAMSGANLDFRGCEADDRKQCGGELRRRRAPGRDGAGARGGYSRDGRRDPAYASMVPGAPSVCSRAGKRTRRCIAAAPERFLTAVVLT